MTDARKALADKIGQILSEGLMPVLMVHEFRLIEQALRSPLPGTREEVARDVSAISDEDMRDLLSAKDVGTGRARLRRLLAALPPAPMPERSALNVIHELEALRLSFRKEHRHADAETITNAISLLGGRTAPAPMPERWQPIETAPKNATEVLLLVPRSGKGWPTMRAVVGHWADGGGDEQPRFRGWFYDTGYGYNALEEPTHWSPVLQIPERGGSPAPMPERPPECENAFDAERLCPHMKETGVGTTYHCDLCGANLTVAEAQAAPMPEREGMRETTIRECADLVGSMRQSEAGMIDAKHSGQRGCDRSDALYDAYRAICALSPDAAPTTMREALIECGDELYAAFVHQTETVTAGQADALRNFARASNCYRAALAPHDKTEG